MKQDSNLRPSRDELCLGIALRRMQAEPKSDGDQVSSLLNLRAIRALFPENQRLLARHTGLLGLGMVLREEVVPEAKVPAKGQRYLAVELMQRSNNFVSIFQGNLLPLCAAHRAKGEIQRAQSGVEVWLLFPDGLRDHGSTSLAQLGWTRSNNGQGESLGLVGVALRRVVLRGRSSQPGPHLCSTRLGRTACAAHAHAPGRWD
mmetsp:Transcript_53444/g.127836  ORF Transcript_53444/g.127836 Transcript_53444/m.127836 type:complete len:203 (-) Transcript_53444:118-726(-)